MRRLFKRIWLFLVLLGVAAPAAAQGDLACRNGMFAEENSTFGLATVAGEDRLDFMLDLDGCPTVEARCRRGSYAIPGDVLVTGRAYGEWTCAYFVNDVGGSAGWVQSARLAAIALSANPPLAAWVGRWQDAGDWIKISRNGPELLVEGLAFWPAPEMPDDWRGSIHVGELDGVLAVSGNRAFEEGCQISFFLLGDYLVVSDPTRQCDGANVAFNGVYAR